MVSTLKLPVGIDSFEKIRRNKFYYIAQNKALCEEHMGKYPVIFLSLKSVEGLKYEDAIYRITELVGIEAERFGFLEDSEYLSENEKKRYKAIIALKDGTNAMDEKVLVSSLQILSQLLYKHFGQKTVILIDEYDVPLDKALKQIEEKDYVAKLKQDGMDNFIKYGIACFKKVCKVVGEKR